MSSIQGQCPCCRKVVDLSVRLGGMVTALHTDDNGRECDGTDKTPVEIVSVESKHSGTFDSGGFGGGFGSE